MTGTTTGRRERAVSATRTGRQLCITVLRGGPSRERAVSLESGAAVAAALESIGHRVEQRDISPADLRALDQKADAVFVALHGSFGEDGRVQELMDRRGIRYTGSGAAACSLAMNKVRCKQRLVELGLPTPRFEVATPERLRSGIAAWTLPLVVKPVDEGSSIHCYIIRDVIQFQPAVERVVGEYGAALIEEFVPGLELTVGILGEQALPAIEIRPATEFYDYDAKYHRDDTVYSFDIALPADLLQRIGAMSAAAHSGVGCRDFSRVDWRVDPAGGRAMILEINTIPGFTSHSLLPMAARKIGLSMPDLCNRIVELALARGDSPA